MSNREDAYRLYQGGMMVAAAYGPDSAREIVHYANVYLSEGEVYIVRRKPNGRWPKADAQGMPPVGPRRERGSGASAPASPVLEEDAPIFAPKGVGHAQ